MSMPTDERLYVFDTTLRDGEQAPGATMSVREKIRMAQQLELLGVDVIEAGFAASSAGDFESVAAIAGEVKQCGVASLCRLLPGDIDKAAEALKHARHPRLHLVVATSALHMERKLRVTPDRLLREVDDIVRYAARCIPDVTFACEDASRSDPDFLAEVCGVAVRAGANTVNIADTVGYAQPEEFGKLIAYLKQTLPGEVILSVHCHNDLGLAVANTLAAIRAGARQADVTVGGIGERAGNCPLEELVMAVTVRRDAYGVKHGIHTEQLFPTARLLSRIVGQPIARNKPIVGANAFSHESGIHQAGVLINPAMYEIMTPASVGLQENSLVVGKHSGKSAVKAKLERLGYHLDDGQIEQILALVKKLGDKKAEVYDEDLEALVLEEIYRIPDKYRLVHLGVQSSDTGIPPCAMLMLEIDGERRKQASFGVGPIHAVFTAISEATGHAPVLEHYSVNAITGGSDALGEVTVRISENGCGAVGRGSHPDIINASARAYVNALNRLAKKQEEAQNGVE